MDFDHTQVFSADDPRFKLEGKGSHVYLAQNGREFFFSNLLIKIYQIPPIFIISSKADYSDNEGSFIVLFYERTIRARGYVRTDF